MAGLGKWAPGGCTCCGGTANVTITVTGCFSLGVMGVTVAIKSGGVTVASGTTDGAGKFMCSLANGAYTVNVTSASGRFANVTGHPLTVSGTTNLTIGLTLAAGYDCLEFNGIQCAFPVKDTLSFTDHYASVTSTLINAGSGWRSACLNITEALVGCPPRGAYSGCGVATPNVKVQYFIDQSGIGWLAYNAPSTHFSGGFQCPDIVPDCSTLPDQVQYNLCYAGSGVTCPTDGGGAFSAVCVVQDNCIPTPNNYTVTVSE